MSKDGEPNEVVDTFWSRATSKTYESDGQIRLLPDERFPDSRTEESNKRWAIRASMSCKYIVKIKRARQKFEIVNNF
jgi:phage I-like protein